MQIDARERPGDGGRDRVALADAGAAVVHHLLLERRPRDARHVDVDRLRAERREDPGRRGASDEREGDDSEGPFHGSTSVASLEDGDRGRAGPTGARTRSALSERGEHDDARGG